ncbi:organic anion transporter 3 isoform X2 [Rhipicephalus microplus]
MGVDVQYRGLPGGTHRLRFADELPRHLMCGLCGMLSLQMFEDKQGHAFCNVCIGQKSEAAAIYCGYENRDVALDELVESYYIFQVIKDQVVFCPNEQEGCPAYSPLCEMEDHYLRCEKTEIECGQCQQRIAGRHWKNHLVNCPRKIVQCCFCVAAFPQIDIQTHQALCAENPERITSSNARTFYRSNTSASPLSAERENRSIYASTDWNLVCEDTWKRSLMQSTYMACLMLAILLIGNISDRFGRRIVAIFSTICLCASAFALTFSSSLNFFLVARIGLAFAISGLQVACFSLLAETIGPKFRIALNVCYGYGWIIGLLLLPGIVWLAQDWRKLLIVQAAIAAPLMFALPWLYESPRWLVSVGKQAEAVDVIRKIAHFNKKQLGDVEKEVEGLVKRKQNAMQGHQSNVSVIGLFKTKYLRRNTLVVITVSFLSSIVYYGFSRTATTLGGNPYLNFGIAAGLECAGYTVSLATTKYLKRVPTMFSSYGFFSLTLLITAFTPREYIALRTTIRMAGWFVYTLGYTTQFVFLNEMFPTVARSGGFGLCSTIGRLGATLEPWINVFLMSWGEKIILILYSAMLFVISASMILLPETLGSPLPDTLEEGELYSALKLSKKMKNASESKDIYNFVQAEDGELKNKI